MRLFIILSLVFTANTVLASGYTCESTQFKVILQNHRDPNMGTKNPKSIEVSSTNEQVGVIVRLEEPNIDQASTARTVIYEGRARDKHSGRFVYITLTISKAKTRHGTYSAQFEFHGNGDEITDRLYCIKTRITDEQ